MKFHGRLKTTGLAQPLAATVAITACAPQAAQQTAKNADVPAAVEQVQQAKMLPVGSFSGMVAAYEDGQFKPVVGATVKVEGADGSAVTDHEGRYLFEGLKPGDYKVVVAKDGFAQGEGTVKLSPVAGTPRVNVAMNKPSYQLNQIAPFAATVTGVVTDPRGAALPNATVRVATTAGTGTNQTVPANANGFYTVTIANMAASPISPGYVQVTAFGTTPGGVKVEVDEVWAKPITSASLVVNARCDAFTRPENLTYPSGTFTPMGATNAAIEADFMSTRADEFYLRITSLDDGTGLPGQVFAVLPESITNTPATASTNQKCNIKFRVPFAFPPNNSTYEVEIVPFGITNAAFTDGTKFVVNYTLAQFTSNIAYTAHTITDGTKGIGEGGAVPNNANNGIFVAGEDVVYNLDITNANLNVSPDLRVKGKVPAGTTIASVTVTTTYNNGTPVATTIPAGNITQPNGSGDWAVTGFTIPNATGGGALLGQADVAITFASATNLAPGNTFDVTNVAVEMPSAGHVDGTPPAAVVANAPLPTVSGVDRSNLFLVSKTINQGTAGDDGYAFVELLLRPTGTTAASVYRFTDTTKTNKLTPGRKAVLNGTTGQPVAPGQIGLNGPGVNQDKIGLIIDGGAEQVVSVASGGWDLETLCAFINGLIPGVAASRDAATNRIKLERTVAGSNRSIKIGPSSTSNLLTKLGGLSVNQTDTGTDGVVARYVAAGGTPLPATSGTPAAAVPGVAQNAGATYQFSAASTSTHNADGSLLASFSIEPTNTAAVGTHTGDITINYVIELQNLPLAGDPAVNLRLGGGGAAMGARTISINQVAPFTILTRDIAVPLTTNTQKADPADSGADL